MSQSENVCGGGLNDIASTDSVSPFAFGRVRETCHLHQQQRFHLHRRTNLTTRKLRPPPRARPVPPPPKSPSPSRSKRSNRSASRCRTTSWSGGCSDSSPRSSHWYS